MRRYRCDHCEKMRHEAVDGYHYAWAEGYANDYQFCDACYPKVLADHRHGRLHLFDVDDKNLSLAHFVCPECLAVKPSAERVEYATSEPPAPNQGYVCSACQPAVFRQAQDRGLRAWKIAWM